jgi:hypothetical protein
VFETTANRALAGYAAGKADALYVLDELSRLGLPPDLEVFFAVDSDVDPVSVDPYFQGVHDVYAAGGVYGSYRVVHKLETELGIAGWQTAAWSNGARDGAAAIFQSGGQKQIGTVTVDVDYAATLGAWAYGGDMTPEDLLNYDVPRQGVGFDGSPQTGTTNLRAILEWTDQGWVQSAILLAPIIQAGFDSIARQLVDLTAAVTKLASQPPAAVVALTAQDKADMVRMFLQAQGAALTAVQVVAGPPPAAPAPATAPAADTPA